MKVEEMPGSRDKPVKIRTPAKSKEMKCPVNNLRDYKTTKIRAKKI